MADPPTPAEDAEIAALVRSMRATGWLGRLFAGDPPRYALTRFVLLRALAFIDVVAFASLERQLLPLLGSHGLLPIRQFLDEQLTTFGGSRLRAFAHIPTIFWFGASDGTLRLCAAFGLVLSLAALAGVTNAIVQFVLWALYLSFVDVGQIFYGYGWESLLLEAGFLAIFLCPVRSVRPFPRETATPIAVIVLFRWLAFRVMFGAGLIKLRGDPCWRDLTCLAFHYETQPIPGPLSATYHQMPLWFHEAGALFNHFVELVVPFFVFGPRPLRLAAGALLVTFQLILISSGNLSFLNWLTLAVCLACFDDGVFARVLPRRLVEAANAVRTLGSRAQKIAVGVLVTVVAVLSLEVVANFASSHQRMNASFEPFRIVNTYGAFGSVGRIRLEVVIAGTMSATPDAHARWEEYEFPCKPGDVYRRPCWITPFHDRLDWQMWFAAMSRASQEPWFVHLVWKLLHGDRGIRTLLAVDPFHGAAPRFVRADLYLYRFHAHRRRGDPYWDRWRVGTYLPPVAADDPDLRAYLQAYGWSE